MPEYLFESKEKCSGCEACMNICPQKIIEMIDDEEGFQYPTIVDRDQCINCGLCISVCPVKHITPVLGFKETAYAGYSKNQERIKASSSGGLASAISCGFIKKMGGVVYGVAYFDNCRGIRYERATKQEELIKFRTSKYAQSRKNDVYKKIQNDLKAGLKVLFIGVPCEAYALKLFLRKDYANLYICTLICHGVTSPYVHLQYIHELEVTMGSGLKEFSLRFKKEGWKPYYIKGVHLNNNESIEQFSNSQYGIAFLYMKRPACNVCKIKREHIHADITIGDYHIASSGMVKPYNTDGVSCAFVHTNRGEEILSIAEDFYLEQVALDQALHNEAYKRAIPARKNRKEFGEAFAKFGLKAACELKSIGRIERKINIINKLRRVVSKIINLSKLRINMSQGTKQ